MSRDGTTSVYLDHGATSFPKAPGVAQAVVHFLDHEAGNPGRGGHRLTLAASRAIEGAREDIANLLGGDPARCLLGSGATFWLNTLLAGCLGPGDRVVVSSLEHNAVMRPLRFLEGRLGLEVFVAEGAAGSGVPSADEIAAAVASRPTTLVVLTHASNVSGAVAPVEEIARAVAPVPVVVDGAQSAGAIPFSFRDSGVAAFACSGHKGLLGPPGTGALLLAPRFDVAALVRGGTGSNSESEEMPTFLPDALEAGTPNGAGIAGLGAACRWIAGRGVDALHRHQEDLLQGLADGLRELPGVRLHGFRTEGPKTAILSFTLTGRDCGEVAAQLERDHGLSLRAGLHCSPAAHRRLGTFPQGTLRAGLGPFNTTADVEALLQAVAEAL